MQNTMVDEIINTDKENLLEDTTFIVDIDDKNTRIDKYLSDELADCENLDYTQAAEAA